LLAALALSACGGGDGPTPAPAPQFLTLDGKQPQVIAHRGYSGLYPEQTQMAYEKAIDAGADMIELDMHLSRDCQLVARHNAWLSDSTNIAEVAKINAYVAPQAQHARRAGQREVPGHCRQRPRAVPERPHRSNNQKSVLQALVVDGEDHTGDWSISDFSLHELRTLFGGTTLDNRADRPSEWNGKLPLISAQDVIDIALAKGKAAGRTIAVYAETKNPYWNNQQAIANSCGTGEHPFEDAVMALLDRNNSTARKRPSTSRASTPTA
jgi:glycerophosphoryl diester phosphodiesterase